MEKVLIVDDQYGIRILLEEVLVNDGYQVFQASDGKEAIKILEIERPDVLLLDLKIPEMDGIDILRERKRKRVALHTKVIVMTAYGELEAVKEAKKLGVACYISKPFDIDKVRAEVKKQLRME